MQLASRLTVAGILAAATSATLAGPLDLYVTSDALNKSTIYNGVTGAQLVDPFTVVAGGANAPLGVSFSPDGSRMLIGHFTGGVNEFDAGSGAYIKSYNGPAFTTNWTGIYAPNGEVYAGDWDSGGVRRYNATSGAFLGMLASVPRPTDMRIGPNGNLYVCSFLPGEGVYELDVNTGATINHWNTPPMTQANDIAFLPGGQILVTTMSFDGNPSNNAVWRYDPSHNLLGSFAGTGWARPHGIEISPHDGNIYVIDGVTTQAHVFDPGTFAELDAAFLSPTPEAKTVDLAFRPIPEPAGALLLSIAALAGLRRR